MSDLRSGTDQSLVCVKGELFVCSDLIIILMNVIPPFVSQSPSTFCTCISWVNSVVDDDVNLDHDVVVAHDVSDPW